MISPEKPNGKRRKEKHNKRKQKLKRLLKIEKTFFKKKREKTRGDEKIFFRKQIFEWLFFAKKYCKWKKEDMINTNFFWKSWRDGYFLNTKRLPQNEIWTKMFLLQKQLLWWNMFIHIFHKKNEKKWPSKNFKKSDFLKRDMMIELF